MVDSSVNGIGSLTNTVPVPLHRHSRLMVNIPMVANLGRGRGGKQKSPGPASIDLKGYQDHQLSARFLSRTARHRSNRFRCRAGTCFVIRTIELNGHLEWMPRLVTEPNDGDGKTRLRVDHDRLKPSETKLFLLSVEHLLGFPMEKLHVQLLESGLPLGNQPIVRLANVA